jgi:hypothetical protein
MLGVSTLRVARNDGVGISACNVQIELMVELAKGSNANGKYSHIPSVRNEGHIVAVIL